jgi:hypothetical protein
VYCGQEALCDVVGGVKGRSMAKAISSRRRKPPINDFMAQVEAELKRDPKLAKMVKAEVRKLEKKEAELAKRDERISDAVEILHRRYPEVPLFSARKWMAKKVDRYMEKNHMQSTTYNIITTLAIFGNLRK